MVIFRGPILLAPLILVALSISTTTAQSNYLYNMCLNTGNYTAGSEYQINLDHLLNRSLYNDASKVIQGTDPDKVYGLFLCRGNVARSACQNCIGTASQEIAKVCPFYKDAIIWYDDCLVRYSNKNFLTSVHMSPVFCMLNTQKATEPETLDKILGVMFRNLSNAAVTIPSNQMFATGEQLINSYQKLEGMVQCVPDLTPSDCQDCLSTALSTVRQCTSGKIGGRAFLPSCDIRYELSPDLSPPGSPEVPVAGGSNGKSTKNTKLIVGFSVSGAIVLLSIASFFLYLRSKLRKQEMGENNQEAQWIDFERRIGDGSDSENLQRRKENEVNPKDFPSIALSIIQAATENFSLRNKLGEGGFGPVYKGTLTDGKEIAVKRLSRNSGQGAEEFKNEVTLIARLQHRNLVRLLGCCLEGKELLLIYEYMSNKSLDVFLFDSTGREKLEWKTRLMIIHGIARGLLYLHEDSRLRIIHRDLKASNVLLDHEMNPKISDFGMARIFSSNQSEANTNRVVGTYGYMAPEYAMEGLFSVKSDVFSFGVLLLEITSGRKNSGFHLSEHSQSLLNFAWNLWREDKSLELLDPLLVQSYEPVEVLKCIHIGLLCVQEDPADRPTISWVVAMLGSDAITLPPPTQPAFSVGRAAVLSQPSSNVNTASTNEVTISDIIPR